MSTIAQLELEIEKDQIISRDNINKEIQDLPVLCNKYIKYERILRTEILRLNRLKKDTEFQLTQFYGPLAKPYKSRPVFALKLTLKTAIEEYVKNDPDMKAITAQLEDAEIMLDYLQRWIDIHIKYRSQVCKMMFDYVKWESGPEGL